MIAFEFEGLLDRALYWLSLKSVVFIMDKAYYSFVRFQALVDRGINFVTPMKALGLSVGKITSILSPPFCMRSDGKSKCLIKQ
ncbi:MAG: hypothetical protein QXJ68_08215 [Methanocellales archaeon]